jgi:hypothetical protein
MKPPTMDLPLPLSRVPLHRLKLKVPQNRRQQFIHLRHSNMLSNANPLSIPELHPMPFHHRRSLFILKPSFRSELFAVFAEDRGVEVYGALIHYHCCSGREETAGDGYAGCRHDSGKAGAERGVHAH